MIPFAIMSLKLNSMEVRVVDLSAEGFSFRLSKGDSQQIMKKDSRMELSFFQYEEYCFANVLISDYTIELDEETDYYNLYYVTVMDDNYVRLAGKLMREYSNYVNLKMNLSDAKMSHELVGYPSQIEEEFPKDWASLKRCWIEKSLSECMCDETNFLKDDQELGVVIEEHKWYQKFLKDDDFMSTYWRENYLEKHPLARHRVTHVYIGNQFCRLLFPSNIEVLLDRAVDLGLVPVVQFADMSESQIEDTRKALDRLSVWCKKRETETNNSNIKLELVINDWGMLEMANKYNCYKLTIGVLLQKMTKDPRIDYKKGLRSDTVFKNSANAKFYRQHLETLGVEGLSYEMCGHLQDMTWKQELEQKQDSQIEQNQKQEHKQEKTHNMSITMYAPFYQTNTSNHCTLYAACHNGNRALQQDVKACPGYCEHKAFLYGEKLKLVGRYNSLFGYDERALADGRAMNGCADRIVINA